MDRFILSGSEKGSYEKYRGIKNKKNNKISFIPVFKLMIIKMLSKLTKNNKI